MTEGAATEATEDPTCTADGRWHCSQHGPPKPPCPFCAIVAGDAGATIVREWFGVLAIVPLGPVVPGHLLVIPTGHVDDFTEDPDVTARVMRCAAELAADIGPCNLITSKGREATQSVMHLHAHVVPRAENDGLALPWYSGKHSRKASQ